MKKIMLITAHPDDAELAMGGTIMKLVDAGCIVKNIIVSVPNHVEERIEEGRKSSEFMNISYEFFETQHPSGIEGISTYELVSKFDEYIDTFKPDTIFTHWNEDSHQDHRKLSYAVTACFRKYKFDLYFFEQINQKNIPAANKFIPNVYVDISSYLDRKIEAFSFHKTQMIGYMSHYLEDMVKLAEWRGYQIDVRYAETFQLINKREI